MIRNKGDSLGLQQIALLTFLCFSVGLLLIPLCAYGSAESQSAVANEAKRVEMPTTLNGKTHHKSQDIHEKISLQCNSVEYGNPIPYPTISVFLKGRFYPLYGKADWLPNDPGVAGKNTIMGIDSDGDCVRDDIERIIARLLPSSNQKKARKYMFEYAKWRGYFSKIL